MWQLLHDIERDRGTGGGLINIQVNWASLLSAFELLSLLWPNMGGALSWACSCARKLATKEASTGYGHGSAVCKGH